MKTQVEFRSKLFPPYEGEEDQVNPGVWGKRLAEFLAKKLVERGIETSTVIPEDWGWYIPVSLDGHHLGVCCGHQSGDDDQFVCILDPSSPIVRRLFKKVDLTPQFEKLLEALRLVLEAEPGISEVEWTEV